MQTGRQVFWAASITSAPPSWWRPAATQYTPAGEEGACGCGAGISGKGVGARFEHTRLDESMSTKKAK